MDNSLQHLLDKLYEVEGLVHLCMKRPDSSADLLRLIEAKGKELSQACQNLNIPAKSSSSFLYEEYSIDEEDPADHLPDYGEEFPSLSPYESATDDDTPAQGEYDTEAEKKQRGKLVFSINDKYRYRKELFRNSDIDFNNTLVLIASMDNYEEAEEYFLNDEGFDPSNAVVREFLSVLKNYFK